MATWWIGYDKKLKQNPFPYQTETIKAAKVYLDKVKLNLRWAGPDLSLSGFTVNLFIFYLKNILTASFIRAHVTVQNKQTALVTYLNINSNVSVETLSSLHYHSDLFRKMVWPLYKAVPV